MKRSSVLICFIYLSTVHSINVHSDISSSIFGKPLNYYSNACRYLNATKRQNHQCRKDPGLPFAIKEAKYLMQNSCQEQFRYDRWNCSVETRGRRNIFKKVYRETAFIHALTAAALTYSIARACAEGLMHRCSCGQARSPLMHQSHRIWGECSDNIQHGKRATRNFLSLRLSKHHEFDKIFKHNSEIGIDVVTTKMIQKCKCHGVFGSCSTKTCWKKLGPFNETAALLRAKYHQAMRQQSTKRSVKNLRRLKKIPSTILMYMDTSPTFCSVTSGRECKSPDNCATLCCGRGYTTKVSRFIEKCRCRFIKGKCCNVMCDYCERLVDRYYCK